jgi:hypothetical protein
MTIKSMKMKRAGHVARMETIRNSNRISVGKPTRKVPLQKSSYTETKAVPLHAT